MTTLRQAAGQQRWDTESLPTFSVVVIAGWVLSYGLRRELEDSPLWKHCSLEHDRETVQFFMKALRSFKSCITRQVNEPVRILSSKADMLLNSKNKFHQTPLTRLVTGLIRLLTGLQGSQEENKSSTCLRAGSAATVVNLGSGGRGSRGGRGSAAGGRRRAPGTEWLLVLIIDKFFMHV